MDNQELKGQTIIPWGERLGKCSDCGLVMWKGETSHNGCKGRTTREEEQATRDLLNQYSDQKPIVPREKKPIKMQSQGACDQCSITLMWKGRPILKDSRCPVCDSPLVRITKEKRETHTHYETGTSTFQNKKCVEIPEGLSL